MHENTLPQIATFANTLANKISPDKINSILLGPRAMNVLQHYETDGHLDKDEWKLSSWDGGYGNSLCFNINTGVYKDFGDTAPGGQGMLRYLAKRWKQNLNTVVQTLMRDGFLAQKEVFGPGRSGSHKKAEYGSLVLPVPEDVDVEESIKPSKRAFIKGKWAYRDTDGSLLGYVVRFEEPGGKKTTPPFTYWSEGGWKKSDWGGSWPLYGLEQLSMKGKGAKIVLVEGEKTAEKAQELLPGCVVLGYGGVNKVDKLELKFMASILAEREIIVWPDNDTVGVKAAKKLCWKLLKEISCRNVKRVMVESIKLLEGEEGWDLADYTEDCGLKLMSELERAEDQNSLEAYVKNYVYVGKLKRFFPIEEAGESTLGEDKETFRDMNMHIMPKIDTELLMDNRLVKLHSITFWPGKPRIVMEDGKLKLNTWTPDGLIAHMEEVSSEEQGIIWNRETALEKTKYFREHLAFIFPDEHPRKIFLSYLKYLIENPGEKVLWAPLIQGEEGTGKSYFGNLLLEIMGMRNISTIGNEQIKGENTGWMTNTTVAIIEEINSGGKREFTDKLKPLITNDVVMIREKYLVDTQIRNRINFLMFTNRKDALLLDEHDRRFFVYYSPVHRREEGYYRNLFHEAKNETWWIYHYLLNEVEYAPEFNPKGTAPTSDSKREMTKHSLREIDAELMELVQLEVGSFYKDVLSAEEVRQTLVERNYNTYSSQAIGRAMSRIGWKNLGQQKWGKNGTEKTTIWAVRNQDKWANASAEEAHVEFDKKLENPVPVPEISGFSTNKPLF